MIYRIAFLAALLFALASAASFNFKVRNPLEEEENTLDERQVV